MSAPTPERPGEAPSLVLQEISTQSDLSASAGLPPGPSGFRQAFRALRHRNFRLFVTGQIVSLSGTWMQNVAQTWLVYRLTHSALLLGTAWFCTQIPVFAFGAWGGVAADRYSRHRLVVLTQTLSMIQAFILAALTLSGRVRVWEILLLAFALGTVNAFDMPARQSLIVEMASKEDLLSAISLNSAIFNSARTLGPAIAGFLVAAFGEGVCFLVNGISFLAVIACLLAMRLPKFQRRAADSPWSHLRQGLRYVRGHRAVRILLFMTGTLTIASMPAVVLMPFFAQDIFHRGPRGLGILSGAMGVGSVLGTLLLAWKNRVSRLPSVILWSALMLAAGFCAFAQSNIFYLSLALMPLIGFSAMRHMASANTLIQTLIADEFRGRIMAFYSMTVVGLGPFGSLAAGALAHAFGARVTVLCGGLLILAAALFFRLKMRVVQGKV
jgi:MFS family permease